MACSLDCQVVLLQIGLLLGVVLVDGEVCFDLWYVCVRRVFTEVMAEINDMNSVVRYF